MSVSKSKTSKIAKPSKVTKLAQKTLGLKRKNPTKKEITEAKERKLIQVQKGNPLVASQMINDLAKMLSNRHLENVPEIPANVKSYSAIYSMDCFTVNGTSYCKEEKTEQDTDGEKNTIITTWKKEKNGTQQPITKKEYDIVKLNQKKVSFAQ